MKKLPVIIPARAGSKGIPGKNIMNFCGKPLIAWSILQSKESSGVSDVYVSTDGADIAAVAEQYGAKVIWRPAELATDLATSEDALKHALKYIEKNENMDAAIFLQATSPIRRKPDIFNAIKFFYEGRYDSVFSAVFLEDCCLWKQRNDSLQSVSYDYKNRGRRQERETLYWENGSIYIFKKDILFQTNNRIGGKIGIYSMPMMCSYQIDSPEDVVTARVFMEYLLEQNV